MYTLEQILDAREIAAEIPLLGCGRFCVLPIEQVLTICNGIGAEWMPEWSRKLLDKRYYVLRIPAMIHDVDYYFGTGTDTDFHLANAKFHENGKLMARNFYAWYNPIRYVVLNDARRLAKVCELFGRKAYDEAIQDRLIREAK